MAAPEPPPAGIADFRVVFPLQAAHSSHLFAGHLSHRHELRSSAVWPIEAARDAFDEQPATDAPPPPSQRWMPLPKPQPAERWIAVAVGGAMPASVSPRPSIGHLAVTRTHVRSVPTLAATPRPEPAAVTVLPVPDNRPAAWRRAPAPPSLTLHAIGDFVSRPAEEFQPPAAAGPLPGLAAKPDESMPAVRAIRLTVVPRNIAIRWPELTGLSPREHSPAEPAGEPTYSIAPPLPGLAALPVESMPAVAAFEPRAIPLASAPRLAGSLELFSQPSMASPAGALPGLAAMPAESMPAVAAVAPHAIAPASTPSLSADLELLWRRPVAATAGAMPGLAALPVETMPAVAVFEPVAVPLAVAIQLPAIRAVSPEVIPQAQAVAGPAAEPVETRPSVLPMVPAAIEFHPASRFPSVARLQPADDAADAALANPLTASEPAAVESMPFRAAFQAAPRPASPAVVTRPFESPMRVGFGIPVVDAPGPVVVAPPVAEPQPPALEPVARVSVPPAGAQPERPAPAIPHPDLIPLEYHCQRITSAPARPLAPIEPPVALVLQRFDIPPAFRRFADYAKKRRSLVLPFEQIFARKKRARDARSRMTIAGKIAATLMVGIALWTGSRLANLGQHTAELRAEVAASERTVVVAESRSPDPTQADFGKGPMGSIRRAIANRAATEITDTFRAGMTAWGADAHGWAPGWQRHPQGYVSTGEMALFRPSLQYTDYHMEFYGQIEDKSMGWVVRAQDKRNYYAMKFTVIEPGLRPIIAMVHYNVSNGKPGHKFQTPLSVMVHNNQPYHVAVDVRGNRFTASIEGEPVESWTDDSPARGGVGFFSEAGEKARLYWMKLSRNQDLLGRLCAYLSGDGRARQQTAELWGPEIPPEAPQPVHPRTPDLALAPGASGLDLFNTGKYRRNHSWNS